MRVLSVSREPPPEARTGRSCAFARLEGQFGRSGPFRQVAGYRIDRANVPDAALAVDLRDLGRLASTISLWRAAREEVARFRPDVAIVAGLDLPPMLGCPAIAVVRDRVGSGWDSPVVGPWLRLRARRFARLVVPSEAVRQDLLALGVDRWRLERIEDAFDVPARPPPPPAPTEVFELVHPGAIHSGKAQHVAIDALSRLPADLKRRVRLTVVGSVRDRRYLSQLRTAATGQPVRFVPDPVSLDPYLEAARLVVYPTALDEGMPDAAIGSMAWARAVVWADRPALRESLGATGLPVPPSDVPALRDVFARAVAGSLELDAIGRVAHAYAYERYTWARLWPRWRMLLARI